MEYIQTRVLVFNVGGSVAQTPEAKLARRIKKMVEAHPDEVMDALLEAMFWPAHLKGDAIYVRRSDDTDGHDNTISVQVATGIRAGDAYVEIQSKIDPESNSWGNHCFRSVLGGGASPRVRNALVILARAIQMDNIDFPFPAPK